MISRIVDSSPESGMAFVRTALCWEENAGTAARAANNNTRNLFFTMRPPRFARGQRSAGPSYGTLDALVPWKSSPPEQLFLPGQPMLSRIAQLLTQPCRPNRHSRYSHFLYNGPANAFVTATGNRGRKQSPYRRPRPLSC